jgi:hypothetical protein
MRSQSEDSEVLCRLLPKFAVAGDHSKAGNGLSRYQRSRGRARVVERAHMTTCACVRVNGSIGQVCAFHERHVRDSWTHVHAVHEPTRAVSSTVCLHRQVTSIVLIDSTLLPNTTPSRGTLPSLLNFVKELQLQGAKPIQPLMCCQQLSVPPPAHATARYDVRLSFSAVYEHVAHAIHRDVLAMTRHALHWPAFRAIVSTTSFSCKTRPATVDQALDTGAGDVENSAPHAQSFGSVNSSSSSSNSSASKSACRALRWTNTNQLLRTRIRGAICRGVKTVRVCSCHVFGTQ